MRTAGKPVGTRVKVSLIKIHRKSKLPAAFARSVAAAIRL